MIFLSEKYPKCFTPEQFEKWVDADKARVGWRSEAQSLKEGYCADCTPPFQARMIKEKKCVYPNVVFYPMKTNYGEYEIRGWRQGIDIKQDKYKLRTYKFLRPDNWVKTLLKLNYGESNDRTTHTRTRS